MWTLWKSGKSDKSVNVQTKTGPHASTEWSVQAGFRISGDTGLARARQVLGDGLFLARPNAVRPGPASPIPGLPWPSRLSRLSRPSCPSRPSSPRVQGRWEAGLSTASRGAQAGCMEGWVPPSRTPEERGCQTLEQWQCQPSPLENSPDSRHCPLNRRAPCGHRARSGCTPCRSGVSRTPTRCDSCRNSSTLKDAPASGGVGKTVTWRSDDTVRPRREGRREERVEG